MEFKIQINTALFTAAQAAVVALSWKYSQSYYSDKQCEATEFYGFVLCLLPALLCHTFIAMRHEQVVYNRTQLVAALVALVVAAIAQWADQPRHVGMLVCSPKSRFQLHGLWHLGTSSALLLIYTCYRTARIAPA